MTSTIVAATRTYSQNQQKQAEAEKKNTEQTAIAELQAKGGEDWNKYQNSNNEAEKQELLKNNSPSYKQASETAQDWGMGGDKSRAVNVVAMAVTGALGGQTDLQVAANALAPYAANIIGKELGHGEDKNKAAQLAAHAILGAALAYVNGGNPAAGGSAAVASEAAADYLTNQYKDKKEYQDVNGEFQPNLLPEDVKTQIRDLTAAIGAVVGGTVGDSAFNAQLAGVVGQNAVENNSLITTKDDGKIKYYTKEDDKYNLLQYLVATNQLTPDQVPDSIFKDLANTDASFTLDGKEISTPKSENFEKSFYDEIKNGNIISEEKYLELMNKNPEVWTEVKDAIETKQFWEGVKEPIFQYVLPGLQLVGGGTQIIGAGAIDVVGCATVIACGLAVGGSSFLVINGLDDIRTGWNNFGSLPSGQTASSTLTSLGVSEGTAGWVKLGAGGVSIGAEATIINKGLSNTAGTVGNTANTSSDIPQRGVLGANAGKGQAEEVLNGGSGQAIAGHGYYEFGTGDFTVPTGTSVITSPYGVKISDSTGRFLENVDTARFVSANTADRLEMAKRWLNQEGISGFRADRVIEEVNNLKIIPSGNEMPNYTISPPTGLKIHENSTTVEYKTPLDQILKPDAGCIALGTCTEVKR